MSPPEHHHHIHHATQGQAHDYVQANRDFFNSSDYAELDEHPVFVEFSNTIGKSLCEVYPFDPSSTTALDFACGSGLSTRSYAPYVKSVLGVDISQKMLDRYTKQAHDNGLADKMSCVCTELKGEVNELDGVKFDVITCVMAYHHFSSAKEITSMLVRFLKPDGMLLVVDIEAPTPTLSSSSTSESHARPPTTIHGLENLDYVAHQHGFKVEEMKEFFEGAGLVSFDMKHLTHVNFEGRFDVDVFLAKGVKPSKES
ncbi:S-adenosyl-L-methionine-dependent methyltransferase [Lentinula guzmanii]|uniref:S-adenosyl-L-methionine-dependent methyltransferase n=1 Tax=Lentinula guzmanii TaxID=2804957 RepID=A0AA38N0L0_9AGAR|nr:S-adenosyl-L-methionine-dependent methyltransferase [Lentinula guzmanii]